MLKRFLIAVAMVVALLVPMGAVPAQAGVQAAEARSVTCTSGHSVASTRDFTMSDGAGPYLTVRVSGRVFYKHCVDTAGPNYAVPYTSRYAWNVVSKRQGVNHCDFVGGYTFDTGGFGNYNPPQDYQPCTAGTPVDRSLTPNGVIFYNSSENNKCYRTDFTQNRRHSSSVSGLGDQACFSAP